MPTHHHHHRHHCHGRRRNVVRALVCGMAAAALLSGSVLSYSTFCGKHGGNEATYFVNPNFADAAAGSQASQIAAITSAADTWTQAGGADFRWNYGGTTGVTSVNTGDGVNAVFAVPDSGGSTLAVTYCSAGIGGSITGFDILFYDGDKTWASNEVAGGQYDLEGVACHELGHALGLGHSNVNGATMYPSTSAGRTDLRSIEADDKAGIQSIYGIPSDPPDVTGVSPTSGPVRGGNDVVVTGTNFRPGASVSIGGRTAEVLAVAGSSSITVRVPAGSSFSTVSVTVTQGGGSDTLPGSYLYTENPIEISFRGNPGIGDSIDFLVYGPPGADYGLALAKSPGPSTAKGLEFCFARDGSIVLLGTSFRGRSPLTSPLSSTGEIVLPYTVPNDVSLIFTNLYVQGVVDTDPGPGKSLAVTNCLTITVFP